MRIEPEIIRELRQRDKLKNQQEKQLEQQHKINEEAMQQDPKAIQKTHSFFDTEELYRNIVEISPDGIVTLNLKGIIMSCNQASADLLRWKPEELIGKHFSSLGVFEPKDLPKYIKLFTDILRGHVSNLYEIKFKRKDGTILVAEVRVSLIKKNGKTIGLQSISRDGDRSEC